MERNPYQEHKSNRHGHGAYQHPHQASHEQGSPACLLHQKDLWKYVQQLSLQHCCSQELQSGALAVSNLLPLTQHTPAFLALVVSKCEKLCQQMLGSQTEQPPCQGSYTQGSCTARHSHCSCECTADYGHFPLSGFVFQ